MIDFKLYIDSKFSIYPWNFFKTANPLPLKFPKEKNEKKRKPFFKCSILIQSAFLSKILPEWVEIFDKNPEGLSRFFKMRNLPLHSFILFFLFVLFVFFRMLLVVSCQLSVVSCQLSVVGCRLTVIGFGCGKLEQLSAVNVGSRNFCENRDLIFHDL